MTPGSEPRHVAHETVEERLAGEVEELEERAAEVIVEEMDLQAGKGPLERAQLEKNAEDDEDELPSMSEQIAEQLGGVRGLVESSVPVLAFVLFNVVLSSVAHLDKRTALYWAIAGSVISALGIGVYRLTRREPVRHAVNGLFGIAVGAYFAWRTGKAENFYLPGILITFAQAALFLISAVIRKPLIGYAWGVMANKGHQDWFGDRRLFRTFQWLTMVWVVSLCVRAGVQLYLWSQHEANALGIVRILISWPIYAGTFAYSAWAIHRVTSTERAPEEQEPAQA
ncbi:DUF3159 domain-containing protein [Actinoplanes sp. NPDC051411]|uniref:DUF3159 domain-containing protein n=1 Tax=Actinoplanes sp. NPDC051411 TaxID=3155522 RepID=UPI0034241DC5